MSEARTRIYRAIADLPGIHFNGLVRELNLAPGHLQYHLRELRRDGVIVQRALYGRTHYYPPDYGSFQQGALALCHRETARDILIYLLENGPSAPGAVAEALGIARSTVEWHLEHLCEQDLVAKRGNGPNAIQLHLMHPDDTVRLLAEIQPTLPARLVDRFTRLVDQYVAE